MFKKTYLIIFCLLIFNSCGYTPIYKGMINANFKIIVNEIRGDRDIGNFIKSNLNRYEVIDSEKIFRINVSSNYSKNSIAKDTTGKTTEYQLKLISIFEVNNKEIIKEIKITETFNMKSKDNKFEESEYETILKENLVSSVVQKLLLQLNRL